jgi:hypothetical protein
VSQGPQVVGYLDALFAAIRAFAQELEASKRWLGRAEQTESQPWRLSFLRAARAAFERAPSRLAAVAEQLAALGPAETLPAPLDRVHRNLGAMRADLAAHGERLYRVEAKEAERAPVGRA